MLEFETSVIIKKQLSTTCTLGWQRKVVCVRHFDCYVQQRYWRVRLNSFGSMHARGRFVGVRNLKAAVSKVKSGGWDPPAMLLLQGAKWPTLMWWMGVGGAHHPLALDLVNYIPRGSDCLRVGFAQKNFHPWPSCWPLRLRCPESFVGSITVGCKLFISSDHYKKKDF